MNGLGDLVGQFLLSRLEVQAPPGWSKQQIGRWILYSHPRLPVTTIQSKDGGAVGWLLGIAADSAGQALAEAWRLDFDCDEADSPGLFESAFDGLGGRFAAVFLTSQSERFYLDAGGSLAAVYCEEQQIVASSGNLISQVAGDLRQNLGLVQAFQLPQRDGYFPFGLTPWSGITRLMPSHYLNLANFAPKRHWPKGGLLNPARPTEETIREIAALIEAFISGVAKLGKLQIPITAGYDSRVLLACSRPSLPSIRFHTVRIPDLDARMDCAYGQQMAKRFGLQYSVFSWQTASKQDIDSWLYRTGTCVVDRITRCAKTDQQLDSTRFTLLGLGGEVGRGYYWLPDDSSARPLSADELLQRFNLPSHEIVLREGANWLNQLPTSDLLEKLDLFYIEQRLGCWAGPAMYGPLYDRFLMFPFNSRRVYESMLSLPQDYRREERMPIDLIKLKWPELLELPFNQPLGLLKLEDTARQGFSTLRTKIGNAGGRRIKAILARTFRSG